jgi:hypothetical protein
MTTEPTPRPGAPACGLDPEATRIGGAPVPVARAARAGSLGLAPGTRLHEYLVEGTLGEGGFGVVYLARDTTLQRTVAIKEYFPTALATRDAAGQIAPRTERQRHTFDAGLRSFVNEARLLASFDHPSLVKVYRFWEDNGTAYMVMPLYEGPTLETWLRQHGLPDEARLRGWLAALLDALDVIHASHCYHRDIAPDNVLLVPPGRPLLLDFGAARRVIGDATQSLTVILKPGYAPLEQYAESTALRQGPWTDIYAVCAVLYACVTGRAPPAAVSRAVQDDLVPASTRAAGRYGAALLAAIDAGLALRPEARPRDVAALRALVFGADAPAVPPPPRAATTAPDSDWHLAQAAVPPTGLPPRRGGRQAPAAARSRLAWLASVVALAAGGAWWLWQLPGPAGPTIADAPPAASAPGPVTQASAPTAVAVAPSPAVPAEPPRPPFGLVAAMQEVLHDASPQISVRLTADRSRIVIGLDRLRFQVSSNHDGHLYVLLAGTDGQLSLLFPNDLDGDHRLVAGRALQLPRPAWEITAAGPPGTDRLLALVSPRPIDFQAGGLLSAGAEPIHGFDLARLAARWPQPGERALLAGQVACPPGEACDRRYGAALIELQEVLAR